MAVGGGCVVVVKVEDDALHSAARSRARTGKAPGAESRGYRHRTGGPMENNDRLKFRACKDRARRADWNQSC